MGVHWQQHFCIWNQCYPILGDRPSWCCIKKISLYLLLVEDLVWGSCVFKKSSTRKKKKKMIFFKLILIAICLIVCALASSPCQKWWQTILENKNFKQTMRTLGMHSWAIIIYYYYYYFFWGVGEGFLFCSHHVPMGF